MSVAAALFWYPFWLTLMQVRRTLEKSAAKYMDEGGMKIITTSPMSDGSNTFTVKASSSIVLHPEILTLIIDASRCSQIPRQGSWYWGKGEGRVERYRSYAAAGNGAIDSRNPPRRRQICRHYSWTCCQKWDIAETYPCVDWTCLFLTRWRGRGGHEGSRERVRTSPAKNGGWDWAWLRVLWPPRQSKVGFSHLVEFTCTLACYCRFRRKTSGQSYTLSLNIHL